MAGKAYLVGAGPGDPELLTLKAVRILKTAEVVLHDDLISPEVLAFIPPTAQGHDVGKRCGRKSVSQQEINELLVNYSLLGLRVVRLKGGDPFIFGRAGEEIEALRKVGVDVEVVPGITAALGVASSVQIPLTHRDLSSALLFITGHHAKTGGAEHWPAHISPDATLVVYMPGYEYEATASTLVQKGLRTETPVAIVSQATWPQEHVHHTTLAELHLAPHLPSPTLLVVGEVVRLADHASLRSQAEELVGAANTESVSLQEQAQ